MSVEEHHVRQQLCTSRAKYRQGRELKAVKTYTVAQESQYILVLGLPAIHIQEKLVKSMGKFGRILEWRHLKEYPAEDFTEAILFKYLRIQSARAAKRRTDDKSFYGGVLHVCYAPEYETIEEVRKKMKDRQQAYCRRLKQIERERASASYANSSRNGTVDDEEDNEEETPESEVSSADQRLRPTLPTQELESRPVYASQQEHGDCFYSYPSAPYSGPQTAAKADFPPPLPPPPVGNPPRFPITARGMNSMPQGRCPNWQSRNGTNHHPRSRRPIHDSNPQTSSQTVGRPSDSRTRNQGSFPLAGPSPPCGPFIPAGHKVEHVDPNSKHTRHNPTEQGRQRNEAQRPPSSSQQQASSSQPLTPHGNIVIKTYQPPKETAKFVPRQVSKVSLPKHLTMKDPISEALKKNALTLKDKAAGPELPPEMEQRQETRRAKKRKDPEMEKVMQTIRERVKQFAEKSMLPPQLKKKRTT